MKGEFSVGGASMKLCFRFVAKLSTKIQNETQFRINFIVRINIAKFQQFFKTVFSRPLNPNSRHLHPTLIIVSVIEVQLHICLLIILNSMHFSQNITVLCQLLQALCL